MWLKHMPIVSLVWVGILTCLLPFAKAHGHGHHHKHLNKRLNGAHFNITKRTTVPGRSNIWVDDSSCSGHVGYISQTFDNVMTIVTAARNAIPVLEGAIGVTRDDLSANQKSKLDFFMTLYGKFNNEDPGAVKIAKKKLHTFSDFLNQYANALSSNSFDIDIYCGKDNWKKTGETYIEDEEELFEFKLKNVMDADAIWSPFNNPCMETEEDEDGEEGMLGAFTTESVKNTKDFITICDDSWDDWEYRLPSKKDGGLAGLKGEFLDELLTNSPEATFLHELTHVKSLFDDKLMEDINFQVNGENEVAYKFKMCHELAKQDERETDISKIRPFQNSDTFTYFSCGLYLGECNWFDGSCKDPSAVA